MTRPEVRAAADGVWSCEESGCDGVGPDHAPHLCTIHMRALALRGARSQHVGDPARQLSVDPGTPNLDGMADTELSAFAGDIIAQPLVVARRLFPSRRRGYSGATRVLKAYALEALRARALRKGGRIEEALRAESECERTYAILPEWARW